MRFCALLILAVAATLTGATRTVDFDREIRPILADNCFACHGPDSKQRVANLRLDDKNSVLDERKGYRIVAPGDPKSSRLIERITSTNKALRMPPLASGHSLTDKQ